ncbi:hypothetical protein NLG97_g4780 [Lecanicillium saksenae]|uniref:Uncharacterized protein n=1 Tax=Lecanicillium saksenae TaxID=468837 RepID=A0ACC1QWU9_9HYPO|nr:hypothetical protein NLG97_g4780 [Lecanicillium saksenae]
MVALTHWLFFAAVPSVLGDGIGMIGFGKTMYQPPCAFACREVMAKSRLLCTPQHESAADGDSHAPPTTPKSCFASDPAFMQTLALCIDTYCPGSDAPRPGVIEEYWGSHVATGSIGDFSWVPAMTYQQALQRARNDEHNSTLAKNSTASADNHAGHTRRAIFARHGHGGLDDHDTTPVDTTLPIVKSGAPLNVTSFVRVSDWQRKYNGLKSFELNEIGHVKYTIIITVMPFVMAIAASLLRFVPALTRSTTWAWINSMAVYSPLWGSKHRQSTANAIGGGYMPTRGQFLYISIVVVLNAVFLIAPYYTRMPQAIFASVREQELSVIGCRAGVMAMGNVVVLTVFAGRNNPLLALTGWNYDTYLLFHRVFGYLAIFHTVLHSILLLAYYVIFGGYQEELVKPYWIWGIVATLAAVLLWPASLLAVRKRFYEIFLSVHHLLVILFLVGYFYHILYRYTFNWGYEIWTYIAGGIWGTERLIRLGRMVLMGWRTADVSAVSGSDGEYLRIDIDNAHAGGLVYLYFPTLSWRFWENHPFSVASSFSTGDLSSDSSTETDSAKDKVFVESKSVPDNDTTPGGRQHKTVFPAVSNHRISILVRVQSGMTMRLAAKVAASGSRLRLPVLVEGPYHAMSATELSHCTSIICIAGGVGVSAVLPVLREHSCRRRLFWGVRNRSVVDAASKDILNLPSAVQVDTSIGKRLDIQSILREELLTRSGERGPTGIIVCGPPEMADDVRNEVSRLARSGSLARGVVLVDEAFTCFIVLVLGLVANVATGASTAHKDTADSTDVGLPALRLKDGDFEPYSPKPRLPPVWPTCYNEPEFDVDFEFEPIPPFDPTICYATGRGCIIDIDYGPEELYFDRRGSTTAPDEMHTKTGSCDVHSYDERVDLFQGHYECIENHRFAGPIKEVAALCDAMCHGGTCIETSDGGLECSWCDAEIPDGTLFHRPVHVHNSQVIWKDAPKIAPDAAQANLRIPDPRKCYDHKYSIYAEAIIFS